MISKIESHPNQTSFKVNTKILDAIKIESDKLAKLFLSEAIPNLKISKEVAEEIIKCLRAYFISMIKTQLELRDIKGESEIPDRDLIGGLVGSGEVLSSIKSKLIGNKDEAQSVSIEDFPDAIAFVNYRATFLIPLLLIRLAILDRRSALDQSIQLSKEFQSEINDLLNFKKYFVNETDPRKLLIMEVNKARNDFILTNKRIPKTHEIAAIVRPDKDKNTLNSEIAALGLKFDYRTGKFADRKSNKEVILNNN